MDSLGFSLNHGQGELDNIGAHDSLSFAVSALKEDVLTVSEGLALFKEHFTELQEGATITESVSIIIIKGSGIINGATINGAVI